MKLHLPKALLVSVLAACSFFSQTVYAENGWADSTFSGAAYFIDTTPATEIDATGKTETAIGIFNNSSSNEFEATVTTLKLKNGDTLKLEANPNATGKFFNPLTIESLEIAGNGSAKIVNAAGSSLVLNGITGSLSGDASNNPCINNSGTLTLATASASMQYVNNTGTLNITGGTTMNHLHGSTGSITFGDGVNAGTSVVGKIETGDVNDSSAITSLTVKENYTLKITGTQNNEGTGAYKGNAFTFGEWGASTTVDVKGTLLAQNGRLQTGDSGGTINISGTGTVATKGLANGRTNSGTYTLNMSAGSKLILGSDGINVGHGFTGNLGGGTIGISANASITNNLTVSGNVTFDTKKYSFSDSGITQGTEGGILTLSGNLSGTETVSVTGSGTFVTGGNTIDTNLSIASGTTLEFVGTITMGENKTLTFEEGSCINLGTVSFDTFVHGETTLEDYVENSENGVRTASVTLVSGGTIGGSASLTYNGQLCTISQESRALSLKEDVYLLNTGTAVLSRINTLASPGSTLSVQMAADTTLQMDADLAARQSIIVNGNSTVNIAEGKSLLYQSVTANNSAHLTLTGAGTYNNGASGTLNSAIALGEGWTGNVIVDTARNVVDFNIDSFAKIKDITNEDGTTTTTSASTVTLRGVQGHLQHGGTQKTVTYKANLILEKVQVDGTDLAALDITNGYSDTTYIFNGSVKGNGKFIFSRTAGTDRQTYTFNGDMSGYSGDMEIAANKTGTFNFNNTTIGSAPAEGSSVEAAGSITASSVNLNNSTSYASINTATLGINGTSTVNAAVTATTLSMANNSVLNGGESVSISAANFAVDDTNTVNANVTVTNLSMENNGVLNGGANKSITATNFNVVGAGTVNAAVEISDKLDVSGITSAIGGTGTVTLDSASINISSAQFNNGSVNLDIFGSGLTVTGNETATITVDGTSLSARNTATWNGGTLAMTIAGVTWNGGTDAATWDTSAESWTVDGSATAFMQNDKVQFNSSANLGLEGNINVYSMTVSGEGTTVTLNDTSTGNLIVGTELGIENGAKLVLSKQTTDVGRVQGAVTVQQGGTLSVSGASSNTADSLTELTGGVTFYNGSTLELGDRAAVRTALTINAPNNSSISLSVASGATATWGIAQTGKGVTSVTVNTGATLNVTSDESRACVFNNKKGSDMTINLKAGSNLTSYNLFGWEMEDVGNSARIVNVGKDATWTIKENTTFYLNKTTINLSGGKLVLSEGVKMAFERRANSINTTADAGKMSVITGPGTIKSGNSGEETAGYTINVVRGHFDLKDPKTADPNAAVLNTADLKIDVTFVNGDEGYNHAIQKTGNGTLELTKDSSGFTGGFRLREGTTKLTDNGTLGGNADDINTVEVNAPATLEIWHSNAINSNITLDGKLTLKQAMNLAGRLTVNSGATFDFSGLKADETGFTTAFTGNGTVDLAALNTAMTTNRVTISQQAADGSHFVFQTIDGSTGFSAVADLNWVTGTTSWNTNTTYEGSQTRDDAAWVSFNTGAEEAVSMSENLNMGAVVKNGTTLHLSTGNYTYTGGLSVEQGATLELTGTGLGLTQISGAGNVTLLSNSTLNGGQTTTATGKLTVGAGSGDMVTFTVGNEKTSEVNIANFSSVTLDKGKITYHGTGGDINYLSVTAQGGDLHITDMNDVESSEVSLKGKTVLNGTLTLTTEWKSTVNIEELTGEGSLVFKGGSRGNDETKASTLKLSTLASFQQGSITVEKMSGGDDDKSKTILKLTHANASGETFHALTLGSEVQGDNTLGGIVEIINSGAARTTTVTSLTVDKLGTIETGNDDGGYNGTININSLSGSKTTDDVLNLRSRSEKTDRTVFNLGTADAGQTSYTGTINVVANAAEGDDRRVGLVINNGTIAQNAKINLAEAAANTTADKNNQVDLAINGDNVTVRGITTTALPAASNSSFSSTIVSGSLEANSNDATSDSRERTLTISTQQGDEFTANAAIKGNLNLVKMGEGKQTFSGDMSAFDQAVSVEGGELAFSNAAVLELTDLTVKRGATLTIGGSSVQPQTLAVGEANAAPAAGVRVTDTVTLEGGSSVVGGGLNLTETDTLTINNISNGSTIALNGALVLPTERRITLDGDILTTLAWLGKDRTLEVFTGVTSLQLGDGTPYTDALVASEATDLINYFTIAAGLEAGSYSLGYTGAADGGVVYIQKNVPEPTTATLSLLALAALAARRRRKD